METIQRKSGYEKLSYEAGKGDEGTKKKERANLGRKTSCS